MSEKNKMLFGLLGKDVDYSFSRAYFAEKFKKEGLDHCSYQNFDLADLTDFKAVLQTPQLKGMNVTIPYKQEVMPFLDNLDEVSKAIGAVNTIVFNKDGTTTGHNTDYIGFQKSIAPMITDEVKAALVLGTGGASKAVVYALNKMGIKTQYVSRKKHTNNLTYDEITEAILNDHKLIVNCTPLGTHPNILQRPNLNYDQLTNTHILFDLIYNPSETAFMKAGKKAGAKVGNGENMLVAQAEASWHLWNM
jgi:shikimate dehydrogenase